MYKGDTPSPMAGNVPNYLVDVVFCRDVGNILPAFAGVLKLIDLIIEIINLVTVFPPYGDLFSKICLDCSDYFSHIWVIGVLPPFFNFVNSADALSFSKCAAHPTKEGECP